MSKTRFKRTSKPRTFFDRKIYQGSFTRTLSIGRLLPDNWLYVRCTVTAKNGNSITIKFVKLAEAPNIAPTPSYNQRDKQNT